uniref:Anion exchange protein n=1 Tax=Romanomermis culicivorax TaxID=13658 RepID=A0A915KE79_ROMCU
MENENHNKHPPPKGTSSFHRERVKFKLGSISDECQILMYDNSPSVVGRKEVEVMHDSRSFFPRPSLGSLDVNFQRDEPYSAPRGRRNSIDRLSCSSNQDKYPVPPIKEYVLARVFVELFSLQSSESGVGQWEETGRWIKYEEDVEGVDHHWGRPHVPFLTFHSLIQLRHCFSKGVILLDLKSKNFDDILDTMVREMKDQKILDDSRANIIMKILSQNHKHIAENYSFFKSRTYSALPDQIACASAHKKTRASRSSCHLKNEGIIDQSTNDHQSTTNIRALRRLSKQVSFFKKMSTLGSGGSGHPDEQDIMYRLPFNAESAQIFVGEVPELLRVKFSMIRLSTACYLPEILDAPIPVKFLFIVLGPKLIDVDYHEIGRSLATLMANENFKVYRMLPFKQTDFLNAIDSFVDQSVVMPPVEIDRRSLITVDDIKKALRRRRKCSHFHQSGNHEDDESSINENNNNNICRKICDHGKADYSGENDKMIVDRAKYGANDMERSLIKTNGVQPKTKESRRRRDPLRKTGRIFGGLLDDLKFRFRDYKTDLTDAFHFQCLTSLFFMFFASVAPAISFGGLMGDKTDGLIGTSETLLAQCICGIIWGLFSCQPMLVMAATGPVVVFEASLYKFSIDNGLEFMVLRFWSSVWLFLICSVCVCFEGSRMVRHVTRFTEDIFATLIPLIFVYESFKFALKNFSQHPLLPLESYCISTMNDSSSIFDSKSNFTSRNDSKDKTIKNFTYNQPDTALLSAVLLFSTFIIAFKLRQLRNSHFFGRTLRRAIGDFGVPISILVVVMLYTLCFNVPYVEQLDIPDSFSTTIPKRGWIIWPLGVNKRFPIWAIFAALVPAFFVFILLFVELEITQSLLSAPDRGLRKGTGFHFDLVLLGVCAVVCAAFGLPWMCAAAVQSLAHSSSLT